LSILRDRADAGGIGAEFVVKANSLIFSVPAKSCAPAAARPGQNEPSINPADFSTDRFAEFASIVRKSYTLRESQVDAWVALWSDRAGSAAVLDALDREDPDGLLGDADIRFTLALKTYGKTAAFPYLIRAQRRHGWGWFNSDQCYEQRWRRVRDLYPEKWFEFLRSSAQRSDEGFESDSPLVVGAPRLVGYLIAVGKLDQARLAARAFIATVVETVSPFRVKPVSWMGKPSTETDLLLSRLTWPSGLVRERAATAIASELVAGSKGFKREFLDWVRQQTLESYYLPPLLAVYRAMAESGAPVFEPLELVGAVAYPSLASNLILRAIFGNSRGVPDPFDMHAGSAPSSHQTSLIFEKNTEVLPGMLSERAHSIDENLPFTAQWSYEFDNLCKRLGRTPQRPHFHSWSRRDGYIPVLDTVLSEVYTSAYLRALAWAITRRMPEGLAYSCAAQACPVDLSLWLVAPRPRPHWALLPPVAGASEEPLDEAAIRQYCVDVLYTLTKSIDPESVARLTTRLAIGSSLVSIKLEMLIQSAEGPDTPTDDAVAAWASSAPFIFPTSDLLWLEGGHVKPPGSASDPWSCKIEDWRLHRPAGPLMISASGRWQWWRHYRLPSGPAPTLTDGYRITCKPDGVVASSQGLVLGEWFDWNEGFQELLVDDLPPAMGCALVLPSDLVRAWANRLKGTPCWLFTVSVYSRKYDYGEYSSTAFSFLLGTTKVIRS
jgi:hypothetical protein